MSSILSRAVAQRISVALACGLAILALVAVPTHATASDLIVKYDQSQLLRMPRPVAEIVIGNPSIADVTVKASNLLVITGKSFGITNIIALDADQNVIQDQRVIVQRDEVTTVNLQKGTARHSYNCSPQCNPTITVGDDEKFLATVANTSMQKMRFSENGGSASNPSGQ
ncbi:MAG: pilus assembly protein N-terminal domain-containing protein [Hyphomicrobiaceae bacterium]